ncbi:hypothetical protein GE09DRAFT_457742 [Coniochaeta sp. 2T2.1]|nr:hypothetical protein GE09DRAFT_457742 [Coniochaeta sp. 2T2.1]
MHTHNTLRSPIFPPCPPKFCFPFVGPVRSSTHSRSTLCRPDRCNMPPAVPKDVQAPELLGCRSTQLSSCKTPAPTQNPETPLPLQLPFTLSRARSLLIQHCSLTSQRNRWQKQKHEKRKQKAESNKGQPHEEMGEVKCKVVAKQKRVKSTQQQRQQQQQRQSLQATRKEVPPETRKVKAGQQPSPKKTKAKRIESVGADGYIGICRGRSKSANTTT